MLLFSQKDSRNASQIVKKRPTGVVSDRDGGRRAGALRDPLTPPYTVPGRGASACGRRIHALEIRDLLGYRWHFWEAFERIDEG